MIILVNTHHSDNLRYAYIHAQIPKGFYAMLTVTKGMRACVHMTESFTLVAHIVQVN